MDPHVLPLDWMVRPAFDLEYKQYVLLGYLQRVRRSFAEHKLFPHLKELHTHIGSARELHRRKADMARDFPGELLGFDPRTGRAHHAPPSEPWPLELIDRLTAWSIAGMSKALEEGTELRHNLSAGIQLIPVGLQPMDPSEGWLLLRMGAEARVYAYTLPWVRSSTAVSGEDLIVTRYVMTSRVGLHRTYEVIRSELIRGSTLRAALPATFAFESAEGLPYVETFMPLAKQLVYAYWQRTTL